MNKETLLQEFTLHLFQEQSLEKNMSSLYNFLSKYIPFNQILLYSVEMSKKLVVPWVILKDGNIIPKYETKTLDYFTVDELLATTQKYNNGIYIENNTVTNQFYNQHTDLFLTDRKSLIGMNINNNKDYFFGINLQSTEYNQFTEEHGNILLALKEIFDQVTQVFFQNTPQSSLAISQKKELFKSSFEQLKQCKGLSNTIAAIQAVAATDISVLITGETGVGKELVADSIHHLSKRKSSAFIKVNCAAISETLIDSELFGHEKGSFTSASHLHQGYFEQANQGTLYLDEIGELSLAAQAKLLRVLETNEICRIGGVRTIPLNVRLIAATHQNLTAKVKNGTFRADLYYRLMVFPICIPPLRKRKEDIKFLAEQLYSDAVIKLGIANPPVFTQETFGKMYQMQWLGNVRQLKHSIERALIFSTDKKVLEIEELGVEVTGQTKEETQNITFNDHSKEHIEQALLQCNGRIQGEYGAAKLLNMNPNTLRSRMVKLDIPFPLQYKKKK